MRYKHKIERYIPSFNYEFNSFEKERLSVYLNSLNSLTRISSTTDSKGICSFDNNSQYYFENIIKDADTKSDLSNYKDISKKLFKVSLNTDSIEWFETPTIVKTRHIYGKTIRRPYAIIGRLRSKAHFGKIQNVIEQCKNISFDTKKSILLWRGGPSGTGFDNVYEDYLSKPSREDMLKLWHNKYEDIDVGLITKWRYKNYEKYLKQDMTIEEMLNYKYLLSIEGNDVATNLKWAMASNSVVIMPKPRVESWFCESLLVPWVHYVPVKDDFSDLYDIKKWCDANQNICKHIIENANEYVNNFINVNREVYLFKNVLLFYFKNVDIL